MKHKVHTLFAVGFLTFSLHSNAQRVIADFENIDLQGADTTLMMKEETSGIYPFESGDVRLHSKITVESWGKIISGFDCSNVTDTSYNYYDKPLSVIPRSGAENSENYVIGFIDLDYIGPDPTATIPIGAKILNNSAGKLVTGLSITNATITYNHIVDNYDTANGLYFKIVIKGYLNEVASSDSVIYTLADFSVNPPILNDDWEFVDLTSLGNVDSLTFDLLSNDDEGGFGINTPTYFGIDNIITGEERTNITDLAQSGLFSIYPNPAHQILNVDSEEKVNLKITNLLGQELLYKNNTQFIDIQDLPTGIYLLNISDRKGNHQTIRFNKL